MNSQFKWVFPIFVIILISNLMPGFGLISQENYTYSNYDGTFVSSENIAGEESFKAVVRKYHKFIKRHPDKAKYDPRLYRTFTMKPWQFWNWGEYLFNRERFLLPYKVENDVPY